MKPILLITIVALLSCGVKQEKTSTLSSDNDSICNHSRFYGEIEICLPEIDGMTETYSHEKVKRRTNQFSYDNNTILGLYLNKEDMAKLDDFDNAALDDYFKVYALKKLEGIEIGKTEFELIKKSSEAAFAKKNWEEMEAEILDGTSELSLDQPVQIESYKLNENIFTIVYLFRLTYGAEERISAATMSIVLLKNTLVYYAYYKNYSGPKTLDQVRAKNDLFGYKILELNK
jgi:hypothetical protein